MQRRISIFSSVSTLLLCGFILGAALAVRASDLSALPTTLEDHSRSSPTLADPSRPSPVQRHQLMESYGRLPLSFEQNQGQTDPAANFVSRGPGYTVFLAPAEAVLRLNVPGKESAPKAFPAPSEQAGLSALLRMKLVEVSQNPSVQGVDPLPGKANYFIGNDPAKWHTNIPTYGKVRYAAIYPGIDLVYYGNQRQLEYDFVVAPGADPAQITVQFEGAPARVDGHGDLLLASELGDVIFHKPVIYQETNGARKQIEGRYVLTAENRVQFEVGAYDRRLPLVIDPILGYSTLLGGTYDDQALAIAIDKSLNAYVAGYTCSADFPVTAGAYQTTHSGGVGGPCTNYTLADAFVTKLNASGTGPLVYSTYLGGSDADVARGIAVDSSGYAYIAGGTTSQDFPTMAAMQNICAPLNVWNNQTCTLAYVESTCSSPGYNYNGFVTKLDPSGSSLVYSTYIGGTGNDQLTAIAVDSQGEAHVAGFATSKPYADINCYANGQYFPTNYVYPTTASGYEQISQTEYSGYPEDVFYWVFSKLTADGSGLAYSSDLFGSGGNGTINSAQAVALDPSGNAYVTGYAYDGTFNTTSGAFQTACASCPTWPDAYVAKFDPSQSGNASLVYGTYLGGNGSDAGFAIAVDSSGDAYVGGATGEIFGGNDPSSTNFPTTKKAFQATCPGSCASSGNSFVSKLNPAGSGLVYSTYFGGGTSDDRTTIYGLALGPSGKGFVAGYTNDPALPTKDPIQPYTGSGFGNAFITEFNPTGSALEFSSPIGGTGPDAGYGIAVDSKGNAYVAGGTGSTTGAQPYFPTTFGAFQTGCGDLGTCDGYYDGFVFKWLPVNAAADMSVTNTPSPDPVPSGTDLTFTIVATNLGPSTATSVKVTDTVPAGTTFVSAVTTAGSCSNPPVGGTGTVTCSGFNLDAGSSATVTMVVLVNAKAGKTIKDTAKVSSAVYDPNPGNNSATVTVPVD